MYCSHSNHIIVNLGLGNGKESRKHNLYTLFILESGQPRMTMLSYGTEIVETNGWLKLVSTKIEVGKIEPKRHVNLNLELCS